MTIKGEQIFSISRRDFLKIYGGLGIGLALGACSSKANLPPADITSESLNLALTPELSTELPELKIQPTKVPELSEGTLELPEGFKPDIVPGVLNPECVVEAKMIKPLSDAKVEEDILVDTEQLRHDYLLSPIVDVDKNALGAVKNGRVYLPKLEAITSSDSGNELKFDSSKSKKQVYAYTGNKGETQYIPAYVDEAPGYKTAAVVSFHPESSGALFFLRINRFGEATDFVNPVFKESPKISETGALSFGSEAVAFAPVTGGQWQVSGTEALARLDGVRGELGQSNYLETYTFVFNGAEMTVDTAQVLGLRDNRAVILDTNQDKAKLMFENGEWLELEMTDNPAGVRMYSAKGKNYVAAGRDWVELSGRVVAEGDSWKAAAVDGREYFWQDGKWMRIAPEMAEAVVGKLESLALTTSWDGDNLVVLANEGRDRIGVLSENGEELELDLGYREAEQGMSPGAILALPEGAEALGIDGWQRWSLRVNGVMPVELDGVAAFGFTRMEFDDVLGKEVEKNIIRIVLPEGEHVLDERSAGLVRLENGSVAIGEFVVPEGVKLALVRNADGRLAVATFKDGETGASKITPIEYSGDTTLVVRNYFGKTVWLALNEGEMRTDLTTTYITDAQNLLEKADYEVIEQRMAGYVDKMSEVWGQNFTSWEEMLDYLRLTPQVQGMVDHNSGGSEKIMIGGEVIEFQDWYSTNDGLGLGWEIEDVFGEKLIRMDILNPKMSNEMISMYVGYIDSVGGWEYFSYIIDERGDGSRKLASGREFLNYITNGKIVLRYDSSSYSMVGLDVEDQESLFSQPASPYLNSGPLLDLFLSDAGLYYRLLSDMELREHVFSAGVTPSEKMMIQRGVGGNNAFIALRVWIKD